MHTHTHSRTHTNTHAHTHQIEAAEKAFCAVLSKRSAINVVCLLHEDFPIELPVFGHDLKAGGGGQTENMHVLMVLGTVCSKLNIREIDMRVCVCVSM